MKRSVLIFLACSILSLPAYSQTGDFTIQLDVNSSVSGINFIIEIAKADSIPSLKVAKRHSVSMMNQKDSLYIEELLKGYKKDRISAERLWEQSEPIFNKYKHFTKDSVFIDKGHPLNLEIQRFLETPVVDLVKEREETVIVIDGHRITGIIEYNGKRDRFYAISPERTPDSRIYTLITTALAYYRSKNPKILLTKRETLGY